MLKLPKRSSDFDLNFALFVVGQNKRRDGGYF